MTYRTHPDSGRITTSGDVINDLLDEIARLERELAEALAAADVEAREADSLRAHQAPKEPLTIGTRGSAYDTPTQRRAYTYKEQPGNVAAYRLGEALAMAAKDTAGDSIDAGLSLLKRLEEMGFGVFEMGEAAHGIGARKEQSNE